MNDTEDSEFTLNLNEGDVLLYEVRLSTSGNMRSWIEFRVGKMAGWSNDPSSVVIDEWDGNRFRGRTPVKIENIREIGKTYKEIMREYPEYFV